MRDARGADVMSIPRSSIPRSPCSAIRRPGGFRRGSRPSGCHSRHTPASCRFSSSQPLTATSRSPAPRRSFSEHSPSQSGCRSWRRIPASTRLPLDTSIATDLLLTLSSRFRERTTDEWLDRLRGHVPCAPVRDLPGALDAEGLAERGHARVLRPLPARPGRSVGLPLRVSGFTPTYRASPALGADAGGPAGGARVRRCTDQTTIGRWGVRYLSAQQRQWSIAPELTVRRLASACRRTSWPITLCRTETQLRCRTGGSGVLLRACRSPSPVGSG